MNKRSRTLQSTKYLEKKRNKKNKIIILLSFCILIFLIVFVLILRLNFFQINDIDVKGLKVIDSSEINEEILSILDKKYLFFIPKSNFLIYPKSLIIKTLKDKNKGIENVVIKYVGNSKLDVNIEERQSNILACEGFFNKDDQIITDIQDDNCYFVDDNGYVFSKAPQFSDGVYIKYYINSNLGDKIIGTKFIDDKLFFDLQILVNVLRKSSINIFGILIGTDNNFEMYYKNIDSSITVIYFNNRSIFDKTASNLISFINDSKIIKKGSTTTPIFESINLRFGNNIFYVTK